MKFNVKLVEADGEIAAADIVEAETENDAIAVLIAREHNITPNLIGAFDMKEIAARNGWSTQVEVLK